MADNKEWLKDKNLKVVIVCGGRGTRLYPYTNNTAKSMVLINEKPILGHLVDFWSDYSKEFIFILNKGKEEIMDYVENLGISSKFLIEGSEPKGIANALTLARGSINGRFILALGDCMFKGSFQTPGDMEQGFGVWRTSDSFAIKNSYSVETEKDVAIRVVEKPAVVKNDACGMGCYFFNEKVFDHIDSTKPSSRSGKKELTDVIQGMIESGLKMTAVRFEGYYININYEEDVLSAGKVFK